MKIKTLVLMALLSTLCSTSFAQSYQNQLKNKYLILNGASCAGLKFNPQATAAAWQNEMDCSRGDSNTDAWRITWITPEIFMMTEVIRPNEISPPRNNLYKIMSIENKTVTVVNYWTGWGNHKPDLQKFRIQ
ncbi:MULTISPECIES: hypothetical protein [Acinetobacter]|jgi:hypothetical protein|uniref:Uncharacterized protein n=1 Tax=Acinetobacter lwoffii TaxID=28090 RepID=A0AAW3VCP0_ACILW|nr:MULTISPECIES: hypothetical protein [Acinetobacter]ENX30158.1 hypothetical protein F891_00417 [Acinetobacter sp. CIP 101966]MBB6362878.1 hypothetical protein [Acinetobacter lwoffii]MEB6679280.1 hypothetical protein [Acinetobacter lwoffii]NNH35014.1 hypothetical protein [Acinetobacter terrestris]